MLLFKNGCVCSVLDLKFNLKTLKHFKPGDVTAGALLHSNHSAKCLKKARTQLQLHDYAHPSVVLEQLPALD